MLCGEPQSGRRTFRDVHAGLDAEGKLGRYSDAIRCEDSCPSTEGGGYHADEGQKRQDLHDSLDCTILTCSTRKHDTKSESNTTEEGVCILAW